MYWFIDDVEEIKQKRIPLVYPYYPIIFYVLNTLIQGSIFSLFIWNHYFICKIVVAVTVLNQLIGNTQPVHQ